MMGFFLKLAAVAAAAGALLIASAAAEDKSYLAEYKLYNEALTAGDAAAAEAHGYAAWQMAEAALGDDKLTAILAYNYGQQAIYDDAAKANAALARAKALTDAGVAELPQAELDLYLAYTAFKLDEDGRSEANALRKKLEQLIEQNIPPSRDSANMWFELASADLQRKRYREVRESAARAEALIAEVLPNNHRSRAAAAMFQGISRLNLRNRDDDDIIAALEHFDRASALFPPQESIESFDGILAQAFAWWSAGNAVYRTHGYDLKRLPADKSETEYFAGNQLSFEDCGGSWDERDPPKYPSKELYRGYVGGVVIGYHFGDDIGVHDVRILAEVPDRSFGEAVLKQVSNWKLTAPLPDNDRCRRNQLAVVTFFIQ